MLSTPISAPIKDLVLAPKMSSLTRRDIWEENTAMRIHNIYSDENGETHFREIDIEMSEVGPDGTTSKRLPATGIYFRTTPADWFFIGTRRRDVNTS